MKFRKFRADSIFDGYKMIEPGKVLVTNEQGIVEEIIDESDAGDDVEIIDGILSPGFINCHCHLELSHMKGLILKKQG
jgi:cytosine/adenosine deaminase-related metal-dependent hydrolase